MGSCRLTCPSSGHHGDDAINPEDAVGIEHAGYYWNRSIDAACSGVGSQYTVRTQGNMRDIRPKTCRSYKKDSVETSTRPGNNLRLPPDSRGSIRGGRGGRGVINPSAWYFRRAGNQHLSHALREACVCATGDCLEMSTTWTERCQTVHYSLGTCKPEATLHTSSSRPSNGFLDAGATFTSSRRMCPCKW